MEDLRVAFRKFIERYAQEKECEARTEEGDGWRALLCYGPVVKEVVDLQEHDGGWVLSIDGDPVYAGERWVFTPEEMEGNLLFVAGLL